MLLLLTLGLAVLLGLAFGSFLNVCIVRLPQDQSIASPRSHCTQCGATLRNIDNIPLLSYLLLRGKCRTCGVRISPQYPLVEAITAAWFVSSALPLASLLRQSASTADPLLAAAVHSAATAAFGFLLIGLAVMDWQTGLLPNEFTLGGLAAGIFFTFAESFFVPANPNKTLFTPEEVFIAQRLGAALAGFLLLWGIDKIYHLVRRRPGVGGGDPKLLAMMGSFLGVHALAVAFLAGTALATLAAVTTLAFRRGNGGTRLPFGSFLALGGLFAAIWGDRLAAWYLDLFH
ncbi:prepilin peptidase [Terriglobus sp.]|uniref:prepilin peptidase n=1 Tax=Terriglobus sp. TaxID=1889013 RepID=UPI003AFF6791